MARKLRGKVDGKKKKKVHSPLSGKAPPLIQKFFKLPFLKFWLESQPPTFRKGGGGGAYYGCQHADLLRNLFTEDYWKI